MSDENAYMSIDFLGILEWEVVLSGQELVELLPLSCYFW